MNETTTATGFIVQDAEQFKGKANPLFQHDNPNFDRHATQKRVFLFIDVTKKGRLGVSWNLQGQQNEEEFNGEWKTIPLSQFIDGDQIAAILEDPAIIDLGEDIYLGTNWDGKWTMDTKAEAAYATLHKMLAA